MKFKVNQKVKLRFEQPIPYQPIWKTFDIGAVVDIPRHYGEALGKDVVEAFKSKVGETVIETKLVEPKLKAETTLDDKDAENFLNQNGLTVLKLLRKNNLSQPDLDKLIEHEKKGKSRDSILKALGG